MYFENTKKVLAHSMTITRVSENVINCASEITLFFTHDRKIMVMPRYNQHADRHNQKSLGFFLQANAESESS